MITKCKLFFLCPYHKIQLCCGDMLFSREFTNFQKMDKNKCPKIEKPKKSLENEYFTFLKYISKLLKEDQLFVKVNII